MNNLIIELETRRLQQEMKDRELQADINDRLHTLVITTLLGVGIIAATALML